MPKKIILPVVFIVVLGMLATLAFFLQGKTVAILQPQGLIADHQRNLFIFAGFLSLFGLVPVFGMAIFIGWKYRDSRAPEDFKPDWDHNYKLSALWAILVLSIISTFAVVAVHSTHQIDPYKPLDVTGKPMTIQVVALQWKWLFIYPEQNIATVNYVAFPAKRPITFMLTADAPMNSFWIPQLGGQMYAMEGMVTQLHLLANEAGEYRGSDAEISGHGFADMKFTAKSTSQTDFDNWVLQVKSSSKVLDMPTYTALATPGEKTKLAFYSEKQAGMYDMIVNKFMPTHPLDTSMSHMDMSGPITMETN